MDRSQATEVEKTIVDGRWRSERPLSGDGDRGDHNLESVAEESERRSDRKVEDFVGEKQREYLLRDICAFTRLWGRVKTPKKRSFFLFPCPLAAMSAWKDRENDPRIEGIASSMRVISDFPKPGFKFKDITTLLLNPKAFKNTVDLFVERYTGKGISVVAGVEARGFIFGPPIALAIGAKFVPLRKPRKLPGNFIPFEYSMLLCMGNIVKALKGLDCSFYIEVACLLGAVISEKYVLEYGTDCLEMHIEAVQPGERSLVVDDLVATGGTLCAAIKLLGMCLINYF
ncbi:hypothetical protein IEQ34_005690 [Dendrobium chrysotoxum]|uniref:adenine phosphoribosyltransferase n=1 Tax=Dendrobium chrysotoxum TaxID=161865 RepID=A0AAV7HCI5_DENCH|nr:hypothetical protein IEQ34_005690 [Dendrobium chrysotoxum]